MQSFGKRSARLSGLPATCCLHLPSLQKTSPAAVIEKAFTWRMQQQPPENQRKYQLFPKDRQLPILSSTKNVDPEKAFAMAMNQNGEKTEKPSAASGLRIRINGPNLSRRRKISVPEAGPMTTVQEVSMDSRMLFMPSPLVALV